jgi:hypothetical protein
MAVGSLYDYHRLARHWKWFILAAFVCSARPRFKRLHQRAALVHDRLADLSTSEAANRS